MRIQNYGDDGNDRRRKVRGYHPPACTCFRCNEERLAKEAAEEEQRRVAEYDRRMAEVRSQECAQTQSRNRASSSTGTSSSPQTGNSDQSSPSQPNRSSSWPPRSVSPSPSSAPLSSSRPSQHPPGPPRPPQAPSSSSSSVTGRKANAPPAILRRWLLLIQAPSSSSSSVTGRKANAPPAILRRWLLLIAVIAGVVFAVLYATNSGPFAALEGERPVAVAAPPQTGQVPQESSPAAPTSILTGTEVANRIPQPAKSLGTMSPG